MNTIRAYWSRSTTVRRAIMLIALMVLGSSGGSVSAAGLSTVTYKSRTAASTSTTGTVTLSGMNVAQYDTVLLAFFGSAFTATTPTAPTDSNGCVYTQVKTVGTLSTDYNGTLWVCASEPTTNASVSVSVTTGSGAKHAALSARVYSGVNNTTPVDVSGSTNATGSGTTIPTSALTTTRDADVEVFFGMQYSSFSGTYTIGSGFGNGGSNGAAYSSSYKTYCDNDKAVPTIATVASATGCTIAGSSPFGYASFTVALQNADCPATYTGTYPNCTAPTGGGGGGGTTSTVTCTNCGDLTKQYVHDLAIKLVAGAITLVIAYRLVMPFWRKS